MRRCRAARRPATARTWAASAIGRWAGPMARERRPGRHRHCTKVTSPAPAADRIHSRAGDIAMIVAFALRTGRRLLLAILLTLGACQSTAPPPADPYLGLLPAGRQVSQAAQAFPISGAKAKSAGC